MYVCMHIDIYGTTVPESCAEGQREKAFGNGKVEE